MKERVLSGIVIAVLAILCCYLGGITLAVVLTVLSLIAYYELTKATKVLEDNKKINGLQAVGYVGIIAYYAVLYLTTNFELLLSIIMLVLIATMFVYVVTYPKYDSKQIFASLFSFVYGAVLLSFMLLVRMYTNAFDIGGFNSGFFFVWFILIAAWVSDTCAYFVGVLFGKHKIFPRLSPKKTIEGCLGGVAGSFLVNTIYGYFLYKYNVIGIGTFFLFGAIGAIGSIVAQIGDLTASAIKRNNDIKDYGHLIPGHGGIMDRFDSIIFVSPLVYIMISIFFQLA